MTLVFVMTRAGMAFILRHNMSDSRQESVTCRSKSTATSIECAENLLQPNL